MADLTGPELLAALEKATDRIRELEELIERMRDDAGPVYESEQQLRDRVRFLEAAALRTPEETAVLRAAFNSYSARKRILKEGLAAFEASTAAEMDLFDALDAVPPERRDELMKDPSSG